MSASASIVRVKAVLPARIHVLAALVALTAALVARAVVQLQLREAGIAPQFAADLSYLVVPALLVLLLGPVLRGSQELLCELFALSGVTIRLVVTALALGVLLRISWWCHIVAGVSLGVYRHADPAIIQDLAVTFQCPPAYVLITGLLVMAILVPTIEEIIHRGIVQTYLYRFGPVIAVCGSAAAFTVFHPPGSWLFVFLAGLVFGMQFRMTRSLWSSLLTHATINGIAQLDWRCVQGRWNPPRGELPYTGAAAVSIVVLIVCVVLIIFLLSQTHRGERSPR